jgi:hypothetical protein
MGVWHVGCRITASRALWSNWVYEGDIATPQLLKRRMNSRTITTERYQLFPSPRNAHREIFEHEVFVPYPFALVDLPAMHLKGKYSLFAASRLADMKQGQLVTFELASDVDVFNAKFVP